MRDSRGVFVRGFAASFGICSAYKAEVAAAEIGLIMAKEMGIQRLILQMDNKACIEVLNNDDYQGGECFYMLQQYRHIISHYDSNIRILHCYREGNKVADKLANVGVVQEEKIVYFNVPPHKITSLIHEDIMGVTTPRLVV